MVIHDVSLLGKVHCFFSSKEEGNMSLEHARSLEEKEEVLQNRERFFNKIGLPFQNAIFMKPNTSNRVEIITYKDPRLLSKEEIPADALITYYPFVILSCCFGDCLPIIIYEESYRDILALVHGGRKNLVDILQKTLGLFIDHFYIRTKDIKIVIGPAIKKESYILPEFCIQEEKKNFYWREALEEVTVNGKKHYKVDLIKVVKNIIKDLRIPLDNLKELPFDTAKNRVFFSHYRALREKDNKEKEGRFLGIAFLKKI